MLDRFEVGEEYPCWYDPIDPHRAVLVRGYSGWLYLSLLIPLSFIVIGGGRLIYTLVHWNSSAERRSLAEQRAAQVDLFEGPVDEREFPTVPADANLTNSPGTTLAYRLPIDHARTGPCSPRGPPACCGTRWSWCSSSWRSAASLAERPIGC